MKSLFYKKTSTLLSILQTAITCIAVAWPVTTLAQDAPMVWSVEQNDQGTKNANAELAFMVPETDNAQVYATCGGDVPKGETDFYIAADIGSKGPTDSAKLRFSGGGKEYEFEGKTAIPASGEGITGARVTISNEHPIWAAFGSNDTMSYQVPGYSPGILKLATGKSKIGQFVEACRKIAAPKSEINSGTSGDSTNTTPEREAFTVAKDLNSPEAWRAFLKIYPQGFYAEVAKNYLEASDGNNSADAKPTNPSAPKEEQPADTKLSYFQSDAGQSSWYNFSLSQDEGNASTYAAGVKAGGLELVAYCTQGRKMRLQIRDDNRSYPKFTERMEQGLTENPRVDFDFTDKGIEQVAMQVEGLTGDASTVGDLNPNGPLIGALMSGNGLLLDRSPFGANFQLRGSRKAICSVIRNCGARVSSCEPRVQKPKVVVAPPRRKVPRKKVIVRDREPVVEQRCRARSVFVEGRGCVRRRTAKKPPRKNNRGCRGGRIRFEGQCLFRSELRGFCGPGFTPRGRRCVSNAQIQRKPKKKNPRRVILKRNNGGTITLAQCRRNGMIAEFGFCVEDD